MISMRGLAWIPMGILILTCIQAVVITAKDASADRGVGITLSRVEIDDQLERGASYELPTLGVLNSGDEAGEYEVGITYDEGQTEIRPKADWFHFEPQRFHLTAGQVQNVRISLVLPRGAEPGDYYAFIEARPISRGEGATIDVAAATHLSFTIKPSGWFEAMMTQINRFLDRYEPWSSILPAAALIALVLPVLRHYVHVNVSLGPK
jgi:hypothetical protein